MDLSIAKKKFGEQLANARRRGIQFLLTFEEWCDVWQKSGKWDERGRKLGQYCMSRIGDVGPYSVNNVFIQLRTENSQQAHIGKPKGPMKQETKDKLTEINLNRPPIRQSTRDKLSARVQTEEEKIKRVNTYKATCALRKLKSLEK